MGLLSINIPPWHQDPCWIYLPDVHVHHDPCWYIYLMYMYTMTPADIYLPDVQYMYTMTPADIYLPDVHVHHDPCWYIFTWCTWYTMTPAGYIYRMYMYTMTPAGYIYLMYIVHVHHDPCWIYLPDVHIHHNSCRNPER